MESFLIKALQLIVSLSLLVFVHELGHYMWARIFGVKVEKFYLFFNPWFTLFKYKPKEKPVKEGEEPKASWRDTEYGIGWLPLGGYCKIAGMIDESLDTEQMKQPVKPWEFRAKPAWQRLMIMIGGVLNNFIIAVLIYIGMTYYYGETYVPFNEAKMGMNYSPEAKKIGFKDGDIPVSINGIQLKDIDPDNGDVKMAIIDKKKDKVMKVQRGDSIVDIKIPEKFVFALNKDIEEGVPFMDYRVPVVVLETQPGGAEKAKMQAGDHILRVDSVETPEYYSFKAELQKHKGKTTDITFERNGKEITAPVEIDGNGLIGIRLTPISSIYKTVTKKYGFWESIPHGIKTGWETLANYVKSLKFIFTKEGAQSLGGFGTIGSIFPNTWNWWAFWNITALISVILAFMNILPIPALDGGHVVFLLYEMVTGKEPSEKVLTVAQYVGLFLLLGLLIYANGNDIYRWLIKPFLN